MATLTSAVINRVLNKFRYKDPVLTLNGAIDTVQTDPIVNDFLPSIGVGSIVQINDEYMMVTATSGTGPMSLTVVRGWLGSTKASAADGDAVYVNPRVLGTEVFDFINECLDQLYPRIFVVDTDTSLTYSGTIIGYELPANVGFMIRVDGEMDSVAKWWKELKDIRYIPQADTTDFPNGKALMLHASMPKSNKIRVIYAKPFTRVAATSDDLEAVGGLQTYMIDLPYYYAMHKLMAIEEVDRSDSSGASSHQRAQDVPDFLALRTADWYKARYRDLLENARTRQQFEVKRGLNVGGYGT